MKNRIACYLWTAVILFVIPACTQETGTPRNTLATPEATVREYCELDASGVRLSSATWAKVLPYISWSEEAGFDRAIVISGFSIGAAQKKNDRESTVSVEYSVLGELAGDYQARKRTETVRFRVSRTDRGWKISEPDFMPPHVLAKAMARHLEETKRGEIADKIRSEMP